MINFRYHVVSIIAVFLALGVGVIMGTAVIDRAVVDRLESQQRSLNSRVDTIQKDNGELRAALSAERDAAAKLAEEGSQRLLNGTLTGTSVLVVTAQGAKAPGLDDLVTLLVRSGADYRGTLRLTDRFTLDQDDEVHDLAGALGLPSTTGPGVLRTTAISRLAIALRPPVEPLPAAVHDVVATAIPALRTTGFLDYEPPESADADSPPLIENRTRIMILSGSPVPDVDRRLLFPLARTIVTNRSGPGPAAVLVASGQPAVDGVENALIKAVRKNQVVAAALSGVDDIDDFAGRLASVLALADLAQGRSGQYGRGPDAQHLLPPPAT